MTEIDTEANGTLTSSVTRESTLTSPSQTNESDNFIDLMRGRRKTPEYLLRSHANHLKKNIEEKKYLCIPCNKAFRDSFTLKKHQDSTKHNPKPPNITTYKCDACGLETINKSNFRTHLATKKHMHKVTAIRSTEA